jgi:hypothetical protein
MALLMPAFMESPVRPVITNWYLNAAIFGNRFWQ